MMAVMMEMWTVAPKDIVMEMKMVDLMVWMMGLKTVVQMASSKVV